MTAPASTPATGQTLALARFALDTSYSAIDASVVYATKRVILDTIACALGGLDSEIGKALTRLKLSQGGAPQATLFGSKTKLSCASVSYVHAHAANALDADEILLHRGHFATPVVMTALAVAEHLGATGPETLAA